MLDELVSVQVSAAEFTSRYPAQAAVATNPYAFDLSSLPDPSVLHSADFLPFPPKVFFFKGTSYLWVTPP
jgi:hypothetical protein